MSIIKKIITDNLVINSVKFILSGLICCPSSGHYNAILLDVINDMYILKRG